MAHVLANWWTELSEKNKKLLSGRTKGASIGKTPKPPKNVRGVASVSRVIDQKNTAMTPKSTTPAKTSTSTTRDSVRDLDMQRTATLNVKSAKTTSKATTTVKPKPTSKITRSTSGVGNLNAMRAAEKVKLSQKDKTYMTPVKEKNKKQTLPTKDPKAVREDYKPNLRNLGSNNAYVKDLLKKLKK